MKEVILITGVTGFLGCHLGKLLIENNYKVLAIRRSRSNLHNCSDFQDLIIWINIDEDNWKDKIIALQPRTIIHTAWKGVLASERDDWQMQSENFFFLQNLLYIAHKSKTQKFIGLGSQAEYGFINTIVSESHPLKPTTAYGAVKIACSQQLKNACIQLKIQWYWLRIFSVFGEKEGADWLIPSVIKTISDKKDTSMAFSPGEQKYAYLYIKDFVGAIKKLLFNSKDNSGIYNISASKPVSLKMIITCIRDIIDPCFDLKFGSLPYRENQSMLIAGNMTLFNKIFGSIPSTSLIESINNTIKFYTSKIKNESN